MATTLLPSIPPYDVHFDLLCVTSYHYVVVVQHTKHLGDIDDSDSPYDTTLT
jgi:hypothetical protein